MLVFMALVLGTAFTAVYAVFWTLVRLKGSVVFAFGVYPIPGQLFFELWIEPVLLLMALGLMVWSMASHWRREGP